MVCVRTKTCPSDLRWALAPLGYMLFDLDFLSNFFFKFSETHTHRTLFRNWIKKYFVRMQSLIFSERTQVDRIQGELGFRWNWGSGGSGVQAELGFRWNSDSDGTRANRIQAELGPAKTFSTVTFCWWQKNNKKIYFSQSQDH